ncbi:MAG TPA: hypothetical protein VJA86_01845 [Candidatus Nanoarchaeia archaeon]|nr:hypothetical protein [Candidatus Nanoarchaeia archaeon]
MTKYSINVDVKLREISSACVLAPFDEGKEILEEEGYKIISLQENARLRMQEGRYETVSRNQNWVKEDVIYIPKKGKFLTKNSPIMANAEQATDCYRKLRNFYLTPRQVEQALPDSVKLSVESIPTNRFADCEITVYAFGKDAEEYGWFLKRAGIGEMPIFIENLRGKPFAKKIQLCWLEGDSGICCTYVGLDKRCEVRGVRELNLV